ncbi:hypothetical protein TELCIR_02628 [Teladorsagia circumcincta]|uniref:Reverse transcriptase domain-containing protein n=1 Tax=Teladorsagia circumcincta TaxID=45464 RepID=A0A2G9UYN4_TELCI|nr:hypothetical protein TELCIR_02628 [Teladorsagia circumcincta]
MLGLVDTGAAITVCSRSIAALIGVFKLHPSPVRSAIGMAGIPIPLVGTATVSISIGSTNLKHVAYFASGSCIPRQTDKYNIIMGNDLLSRLSSWHINYRHRRFTMGQDVIPILTFQPTYPGNEGLQDTITVRAARTSIIPPRSETFIHCCVSSPKGTPMALIAQASTINGKHLFVAPAVFHGEHALLLVTNPTSRPEILYERQRIGAATTLTQDGSGILLEDINVDVSECGEFPSIAVTDHKTTVSENALNIDLSQSEVSDAEKDQLRLLFLEYQDRISHSSYDLGSYTHTLVNIKTTTDSPPTRFRPPRIPVKFQKELDDHINKLLKAGRIVESDTPWVHNTVLVKKKDGTLRVCLDFRPLNEVTIPDHYPLPRIEDLLVKVAGNRYYATLDLASGYMQLRMTPQSQEKCGWATHRGIYQFVYLPFGLRNAGAYFCRAMARILSGLDDHCLAYIDDIIYLTALLTNTYGLFAQSSIGFASLTSKRPARN